MLEVELEQWGKDWNEGVQSKHRVHMSKWKASRKCQYAIFHLPQVIEFKHIGSTLQSNGDMHIISGHEDTVWMKQLEEDFGVPCDNRIPPHVNGQIHKRIDQPAILHETKDSQED